MWIRARRPPTVSGTWNGSTATNPAINVPSVRHDLTQFRDDLPMQNTVTEEKIDRYHEITKKALDRLKIAAPDRSYNKRLADDFLNMAVSYYNDAKHFRKEGDLVTAFAAVNYAHGWLDCGARIGLFDVGGNDVLFTLYE